MVILFQLRIPNVLLVFKYRQRTRVFMVSFGVSLHINFEELCFWRNRCYTWYGLIGIIHGFCIRIGNLMRDKLNISFLCVFEAYTLRHIPKRLFLCHQNMCKSICKPFMHHLTCSSNCFRCRWSVLSTTHTLVISRLVTFFSASEKSSKMCFFSLSEVNILNNFTAIFRHLFLTYFFLN